MDESLNIAPLALAVLLCGALGHLVDRCVFGLPGVGVLERAGRALLLGFGTVGVVSLALDQLRVTIGPGSLGLGVGAVALACLALARWRPRLGRAEVAGCRTGLQRLAVLFMALLAAVSLVLVVRSAFIRPTFQFDALTRWMFKTRVLVEEGTLRGDISTDPDLWFTHQRYPPLVSHVAATPSWVLRATRGPMEFGNEDDRIDSALYVWFAVGLVLVLYGGVARRAGRLAGAFAASWTASLPLVAYLAWPPPGGGAFSALADIPLAAFALAATLATLDALEGARPRAWLEAALWLAFAALTKNEGLPLVAAFGVAVLVAGGWRRWRPALAVTLSAGAVYALLWGLFSMTFEGLDENYWERLNTDAVSQGLRRIPMIAQAFFAGMLDFRQWNITWLAVALLVAFGWPRRPRTATRLMLTIVVVQLLAYAFAYLVTKWTSARAEFEVFRQGLDDPLAILFGLTMGRLLMHVAPIAIALAALSAPFDAPAQEGASEGPSEGPSEEPSEAPETAPGA